MFDTIHLDEPLTCPSCGDGIDEIQTKEFANVMDAFRIGSVVRNSPVLHGIIKEWIWCPECRSPEKGGRTDVFLVIFHSVLAGVTTDEAEARRTLESVDRLDLIRWLEEAQMKEREWRTKMAELHRDLRLWWEDQRLPEGEKDSGMEATLRSFFGVPDEIKNAKDPLKAILDRNPVWGERAEDDEGAEDV